MNFDILDALRASCNGFTNNLDRLRITLPDVRRADDALEKSLTPEVYARVEEAVDALSYHNERQGFINGFRLAMQLAFEVAT